MSAAGVFKVIAIEGPTVTIENPEGMRKRVLAGSVRAVEKQTAH
ncbi:MAG: hypothetical protein ACRDL7_09040 [Gaiellaceae bacterium]